MLRKLEDSEYKICPLMHCSHRPSKAENEKWPLWERTNQGIFPLLRRRYTTPKSESSKPFKTPIIWSDKQIPNLACFIDTSVLALKGYASFSQISCETVAKHGVWDNQYSQFFWNNCAHESILNCNYYSLYIGVLLYLETETTISMSRRFWRFFTCIRHDVN